MRTVFPTHELAHIWANQRAEDLDARRVGRCSSSMNPPAYFTMHHAPSTFIYDYKIDHNHGTSRVTIDGAIIDPQFMRSCPVALVCDSQEQVNHVRHIVMLHSLETPTLQNFTNKPAIVSVV